MGGERKYEGRHVTVIEAERSSFSGVVAVTLWLCGFHLNLLLLLSAFIFFPVFKAAMMVVVWYVFLVGLPLLEKGKYAKRLARFICKHSCGYFPITFHVEDVEAFDANRTYVYGYEPHSVMSVGLVGLVKHAAYLPLPNITVLATSAIFYTPIVRHIWAWMGMSAATRSNFRALLASGESCLIIPGGMKETFYTNHHYEVAVLSNRKGFIRIAIEAGTPLVPVFCFGQTMAYNWWVPSHKLAVQCCSLLKFSPMLLWGKFGSPLPIRNPMHVIIGRPINVTKNPNPTIDEVNEVHGRFVEAMEELFERHKARVGYAHLQLTVL